MSRLMRTAEGGRVDRSRQVQFRFDGRSYSGLAGDTLASALLANGVHLMGRSFKYHRPRGVLSSGSDEPNALVTLGKGGFAEANARATMVELFDGLEARSQNAWPSLGFDLGRVNDWFSRFIPAGFYYKTFLGSSALWTRLYEPVIRRLAGLGPAPVAPDSDAYTKRHAHCDVLVVGAGPAGLSAARIAAVAGARVMLLDENARPGGQLRAMEGEVEGLSAREWVREAVREISQTPGCMVLKRTTAFGVYDQGMVMAVERLTDHLAPGAPGPRQRLWQIRARRVIVAAGAHQQPIPFANNDLPGIMLASAARMYLLHYGVRVGKRIVLIGEDDITVSTFRASGSEVVRLPSDTTVVRARGRKHVRSLVVRDTTGGLREIACDCILMGGAWQPALHLHSQAGGKAVYSDDHRCFVPGPGPAWLTSAGTCRQQMSSVECIADGRAAADGALRELRFASVHSVPVNRSLTPPVPPASILTEDGSKAFVDFQNDVTTADIDLAHREGFVSVEHLKRYTTTGMATDQGKLSNLAALSRMAVRLGVSPSCVGTTTFRPPYTPVSFGTLANVDRGALSDPVRHTPLQRWHQARGAVFEDVGQWKRPRYYPRPGESMQLAVARECLAVRTTAGILDASTLGKIDIQGPDSAEFLERIYTNAWRKLAPGRCRYGLLCTEDGMVLDDGVSARISENHFIMFTTTGNAARVLDHMEDYLQTEWADLKVYLTSVTEHWATTVVTGPNAREIVRRTVSDIDFDPDAFPHLAWREGWIADVPVRVYRISFTGELSFEVHCPSPFAAQVWEQLIEAGEPLGLTPYGTEAMHVLRAEKGYIIVGQETDGTVTPLDLGMSWAIARSKPDYVGKRSLERPEMLREDRRQLVGLTPLDGRSAIGEGAQVAAAAFRSAPHPMLGHVTSAYRSATFQSPFALALIAGGRSRMGETVYCHFGADIVACRVTSPVFYDPSGEKIDG